MNLDEMVGKKQAPLGLGGDRPLTCIPTPPEGPGPQDPTAITFVIGKFREYYDLKKSLKAKLEETQKLLDQWEEALLERFAEEGVQSMKTDMGTFYTRTDTFCSYDKDRELETFSWLREHGEGSLIKETINSKTLAGWVKEVIESGAPWVVDLPDFFTITQKPRVGVRSK